MFWVTVAVVAGLLGWISWMVAGALQKPLTPVQQQQIYNDNHPGYIQKKADRVGDDMKQIINKDPLKSPPGRVYNRGRGIVYEAPDGNGKGAADYYTEGGARERAINPNQGAGN